MTDSTSPMPVEPTPPENTSPVTPPQPASILPPSFVANANPPPAPQPAPPAPKKELTPEEKKTRRKIMLKRLIIVGSVVYVLLLVLVLVWGIFLAQKDLSIFDYLPVSQAGFSKFFWYLFNVLIGAVVVLTMLKALYGVLRSLLTKKEDVDKKKHYSRMGLWYGLGFLGLGVLWLVGVWFLGPRLVIEERYGSPIITTPENTIGLTSPITITFDASLVPIDTDTYSILSYTWNFGDGETGNGQTVTHEYTRKATGNGIYTVTLNVTYRDLKSGAQFDYETSTEVSIANEQTSASFVANPDSGEIPLFVEFDATSSFDPDGEIAAYEWDFDGDGRFDDAEGEIVEHEFTQEGTYEVTLRVTDNNGESATATETIEAGSVGGLRAIITSPVGEGEVLYTGERYEFNGELSQYREQKIVKYKWDMGDGTKLEGRSVKHEYSESGPYTITLTVVDADDNSDETTLEIQVVDEGTPPKAAIETDPAVEGGKVSGSVPLEVTFDGSGSTDPEDDIVDYEWDFDGDGQVDDTGSPVTYTYNEIGKYEAQLTVTDSAGNTAESTVQVEVGEQGVVAELEADLTSGEVPLTVKFDASASTYKEGSIVSYEIDFGDGSDLYVGDATVTYKYNAVGTYKVTLTVIGDDGSKDTDTLQIVVRPVSLTACFTVNTPSGSAPLFVVVDPSCSQGTIKGYEWNFGDGDVSFDHKPEVHTYDKPGTYTITLEITGDNGIVDTFTKDVTAK